MVRPGALRVPDQWRAASNEHKALTREGMMVIALSSTVDKARLLLHLKHAAAAAAVERTLQGAAGTRKSRKVVHQDRRCNSQSSRTSIYQERTCMQQLQPDVGEALRLSGRPEATT